MFRPPDEILILQEKTKITNFYLDCTTRNYVWGYMFWGLQSIYLSTNWPDEETTACRMSDTFIDSMSNQFVMLLMINLDKMCEGLTSWNNWCFPNDFVNYKHCKAQVAYPTSVPSTQEIKKISIKYSCSEKSVAICHDIVLADRKRFKIHILCPMNGNS